jgi:hypothetical protein
MLGARRSFCLTRIHINSLLLLELVDLKIRCIKGKDRRREMKEEGIMKKKERKKKKEAQRKKK